MIAAWKLQAAIHGGIHARVLDMIGGIHLIETTRVPRAATDGIVILVNPTFFGGLTLEQQTGVLLHEMLHIRQEHHERGAYLSADGKRANLAMDCEINPVVERVGLDLPSPVVPEHYNLPRHRAWEWYYREIVDRDDPDQGDGNGNGNGQDGGAQCDGAGQDDDGGADNQDGGTGQDDAIADGVHSTGSLADEMGVEWDKLDAEANAANAEAGEPEEIKEAFSAGSEEGDEELESQAEAEATADWQDVIVEALRTGDGFSTDWAHPSRRCHGRGYFLPRRRRKINGMSVALVVDVSGSCVGWLDHWQRFANEMLDELTIDALYVIYHDVRITKMDVYDGDSEVVIQSPGGGGTCHREALAKCDELDIDAVIVFSDCDSRDWHEPAAPTFIVNPTNHAMPQFGTAIRVTL